MFKDSDSDSDAKDSDSDLDFSPLDSDSVDSTTSLCICKLGCVLLFFAVLFLLYVNKHVHLQTFPSECVRHSQ